ncbi:MAG: TerB family tellurite resistance protein [Spirochaetes bacterium]|nr:TerB family tellurite resistance protein [Spirochaetota bacterium]
MRRNRGKLFGAALGFTFGGPIGALIGAAAGHIVDTTEPENGTFPGTRSPELEFVTSLTLLLAGTARADGEVTEGEKQTIKNFFKNQVGYGLVEYRFVERIIDESFVRPFNLDEICATIARRASYEERLFLVSLNYQVAVSDGALNTTEETFIEQSSRLLCIERYDYMMIRQKFASGNGKGPARFRENVDPYAVLGVPPECGDDEVVRAFRTLASKYHPDKVSHLGKEFIELATRKFTHIQQAYDRIRLERGLL